jgi:hypothetical protein
MPSAWITHVKKYAAENNISYKDALSEASASYKKGSGPFLAGRGKQEGGFIFSLSAIIAAASAAAASAAAAASTVAATTIVGSVTIGSAASATASVVGPIIATKAAEKILGAGMPKSQQKQVVKQHILGAIEKSKITLKDFSSVDQKKIKEEYEKIKANPSKKAIVDLGKKIAPAVKDIMKNKIAKNLQKTPIKGAGFNLAGSGSAKFESDFVKKFAEKL